MSRVLAVLLGAAAVVCALLAVWVTVWWVLPVPVLATGAGAAWMQMTPDAYLDAIDDTPSLPY